MPPKTLRFRARPYPRADEALPPEERRQMPLVQNLARFEAGIKSFIGCRHLEVSPDQFAFVSTEQPEQVAYDAHYVMACLAGDLEPADAETAKACGVSFDPAFDTPAKAVDKAADKAADKPAAKSAEKG